MKFRFSLVSNKEEGSALPPDLLDLDEEVFYLRVERSVREGRKHDGKVIAEVEQHLNKHQFGRHLPAKQAKKAMTELGIPAEHIPSDRALDGVRHRHLEGAKSYDGKFVSTFRAFCQNPPLPVAVLHTEETPLVSEETVRVLFYEQENLDAVIAYLGTQDRCVLVMDATFKTNVQDLVLASLGLVVLHQVGGVVRNRFWPVVCAVCDKEDEPCYALLCRSFQKLLEASGLDWKKLVTNVVMDGAGGAINATSACFPDATLHRDLEHIKLLLGKLPWGNAAELVGLFEEKFADYLEKWVLQKKGLWWSADWQSGLGQVCPGYGTYVSNSQERAWRSIKGLFKKGFRHQDVSQLVRETAVTLQTLVRGGQYAKACFQIEEPPESLAYSAKRLKSEQDDEGTQSHRLTLDLMQQWRDKEGDANTFLKYETAGRIMVDCRTVDITSVIVMPKYKLEYAKNKKRDMVQRLDLALCSLYEDGEAAFRTALGNPRQWSFSMHKKLFYKYTVMYVLSTGRVVDEHPHLVHSSCSEQAFFYKSVLGSLNLHPIARGPKTLKARRPRRDRRTEEFRKKMRTPSP
ncbi:unnamed protein product [Symbiodinium natans]|uniref:MULE transposase domain-containing protein n=1 Tax=Symbiodinium natans TaxID=878477 RepID=A0A812V1F2_9DINO|nr:unnamed protein product [Symbiodinium natans]